MWESRESRSYIEKIIFQTRSRYIARIYAISINPVHRETCYRGQSEQEQKKCR